jgi:hypothetical protein
LSRRSKSNVFWRGFFLWTQEGSSGSTHKHWERHLVVVPMPMPTAPRRYLAVVARRLPGAVVCYRYLNRGAEAAARGAVPCASQVLDPGAKAVARGAARCASHVLGRGAQPGAQAAACGGAMLSQQEKNSRQMSRRADLILPASSAQRQRTPRGDIPRGAGDLAVAWRRRRMF